MADDLIYLSALELVRRYRDGEISPVEVAAAVLARIDDVDQTLNAFRLVDAERALDQARESEARWRRGEPKGLIDGVPTSVKDLILTRGWPTLRGSPAIDPAGPWDQDAPVTARLREHGAVLLGKTTTPEFGWKGVTDSPLTGITRNPWDPDKTPGGSSGGAAAAAAAGMGALHVGTDGGGSIRIPAGFTGIFGLKPSFGRVPAYPLSPFGTVSHVGPMARTAAEAALMLSVISGPDARDWYALPPEGVDYVGETETGIAGLKVAFSADLGFARVDSEVAQLVARAAEQFSELGAHVEPVDPGFDDPTPVFDVLWKVGVFNALKGYSEAVRGRMDPGLQQTFDAGRAMPLQDYLDAGNWRQDLGSHMRAFHQRHDLLLTPSLAVPAFDVGVEAPPDRAEAHDAQGWTRWLSWTPFSYPFNMTQQPACSVPCGFTRAGLPVGLQIVGPMFDDRLVLRAARAYEAANPIWPTARPPL